jgi:hypothetical protein
VRSNNAGPSSNICDECVATRGDILTEIRRERGR